MKSDTGLAVLLATAALLTPGLCRAQNYIISTVAGGKADGPFGIGDGQPATNAFLNAPSGVALDSAGNIYIADTDNQLIRKVATNGVISTFAGTSGVPGFAGDGGKATSAKLDQPVSIAVDQAGNVYFADNLNNRIRKIATNGIITTIAGNGLSVNSTSSTAIGDGGPATSAILNSPQGVYVDSAGNLYICDYGNNRLRKVDTSGNITTVAGNGSTSLQLGSVGDGGPATAAAIGPYSIAFDGSGNLYIADTQNNRIRKVSTTGTITTIAGGGNASYSGDGAGATLADLNSPQGIAIDSAGNLYIADTGNNVIRYITASGTISTIAGITSPSDPVGGDPAGSTGDGGPASAATLDRPSSLFRLSSGLIYIACNSTTGYADDRIRLLTPASGAVPTITNNGVVPINSTSTTIQPGSWVSIYGTNLAATATTWNGDFPTTLGGVAVTIDGLAAYLWYVSPTQINLQAPNDANTGSVSVVVTNTGGSATSTVTLGPVGPSLSLLGDGKHAVAIVFTPGSAGNSGNGYDIIGPGSTAFPYPTRPAKAGETLVLYGVGFGTTLPVVPPGQAFSGSAPVVTAPTVTIGNASANVVYAGIVEAGLYQINVVVPAAGSGDQAVVAMTGGVSTQSNVVVTLQ
jgi:uncharacterized protein (TIGR03437 family)